MTLTGSVVCSICLARNHKEVYFIHGKWYCGSDVLSSGTNVGAPTEELVNA